MHIVVFAVHLTQLRLEVRADGPEEARRAKRAKRLRSHQVDNCSAIEGTLSRRAKAMLRLALLRNPRE